MGAKSVTAILKNILKDATPETEAAALKIVDANRAKDLPEKLAKINQEAFEVLKSRDNVARIQNMTLEMEKIRNANAIKEEFVDFKPKSTDIKVDVGNKDSRMAAKIRQKYGEVEYDKSMKASKAQEDTVKVDTKKLSAVAAAPAFSSPLDTLKSGYDKFAQARQSVVNKIVDLTGAPLNDNPHVPQYAKDTYNKAADSLVSNATDPLNALPGFGAADAVMGAGATAYDIYSSGKPTSKAVDNKPVTNPTQVVNWKSR